MEHFMQFLFPHYIFLVLFEDPCDTTTGFTAEDFLACYKTAGQRRKKNICFAKYLLNALHPCMFHVIALKKSAALKNANMHFWHLNTILNVRSKMQWGYYFPLQIRRFIICWYILVDPEGNDIHIWNLFFCQSKRYCTDDTLNLSIPSNTNQILVTVSYCCSF